MGWGNSLWGKERFGGDPETAQPSLAGADPVQGAVISATSRQLRLHVASAEGVGIDIDTIEVELDSTLIYGLGADTGSPGLVKWHPDFATSYWYLMEDAGYTVVINNDNNWAPGAHTVIIRVNDLNGVGDF